MNKWLKTFALLSALCFYAASQAQSVQVRGKVVDEANRPLAGAVVNVREGTVDEAATTDANGNFVLRVRDKARAVVDISLLGYLPAQTRITADALFIKLREKPLAIDDVVVVAYGSVSKRDLTGVVAEADVDEMKKAPVISFAEALAGRVAGVAVSAIDGQTGAEMNVVIRGANSITQLTWDRVFRQTHRLGIMGGTSLQTRTFEQYGYTGYQIDEYEQLGMSALDNGLIQTPVALQSKFALASFFGRFNYGYKSRYLFTLTLRADGSSKFPNHKWGFFPSGAFSWNIAEERFMRNVKAISLAKLRISYGATGNNRVGDYDAYPSLTVPIGASYSFGNAEPGRGLVPGTMGNADLRWETTWQLDLGLDLSLFEERIGVVVDLYRKDTKDLLLLTDAPRTTGYPSIMKNTGEVQNKGLELTLNTVNVRTRNFEWSSAFNIAFNRNKVVRLDNDMQQMSTTVGFYSTYKASPLYLARVGRQMGLFYGYVFDGVYQLEDFDCTAPGVYVLRPELPSNSSAADHASIRPGDIKYRDLNGDGQVDSDDMTIIGNGNPVHTGGFTNVFRYKNIDLSFLLQWSCGNDLYNANRLLFEGNAMRSKDINQYAAYNERWTPDNPSNQYYRAGGEGPAGRHSSRVVEDGSYLRLKTLTVGYSFSRRFLSKLRIKECRLSFSANNLLTLTGYSGMDPEVSTRGRSPLTPGFDYSAYPVARTFVFGVQMSF